MSCSSQTSIQQETCHSSKYLLMIAILQLLYQTLLMQNSNILSATLCLVKELDYPSLEVVEMAVRCRMDELDE